MKPITTLLLAACVALASCAGPQVQDYAAERPLLDLRSYLDGPLLAHGVVTDRSGKVTRRFVVQLEGVWKGDVGTLTEDFRYSDGSTQQRVWHLTRSDGGRYEGRADDVVGVAVGQQAGNAFNWRYTLALPVDGRVWEVQFDDWMFLIDERTLLNRAAMSKFGVHVGDVTLSFTRLGAR